MKYVTVIGPGVLGSQIAFQTAFSGFDVVAFDVDEEAIEQAKIRFAALATTYRNQVSGADDAKVDGALGRLSYSVDLAEAVHNADLVIEAAPENIEVKNGIFQQLSAIAPAKTIFATNSSTLLPSAMAPHTGRPEKFLALHFANHIWAQNTAEIMGTAQTSPEVYATVVQFAQDIGMVPIELKKEQAGYLLNSLLVPLLAASSALYVDEIASPDMIDKTWRLGTGSPRGPFQIQDIVGLTTFYNITSSSKDAKMQKFARQIKAKYIGQGKLGVATGEGFYTYRQ